MRTAASTVTRRPARHPARRPARHPARRPARRRLRIVLAAVGLLVMAVGTVAAPPTT